MIGMDYMNQRNLVVVFTIFLIVVLFAVFVEITTEEKTEIETESAVPIPVSLESKVLMVGEVFWGRYKEVVALSSELKYEHAFSGLETFSKDNYDAWYGQLECPITDNFISAAQQEATLTFNCRPEFLEEASKWFEIFNLANNHTDNMGGQEGINTTREYLEEYGIQHHGHYDNNVKDELCEVVSLPAKVSYSNNQTQEREFPVVFCGYHGVFAVPTAEQIDVISDYAERFITIASPQMGAEYTAQADSIKTNTYRAMIDSGADAVIASHPHWVQNTEIYQGKLIVYSVGNFIFDQQDTEEVRQGVAISITVDSEDAGVINDWLDADLQCREFKDDCLSEAQELNLRKPDFNLSYEAIPSYSTNHITSLAPDNVANRVLERLNWVESMEELASE